jgi:N6-adenosine-specific RNA methylase IME4
MTFACRGKVKGSNPAATPGRGLRRDMKKYQIIYADPPWRFKVWSRDTGLGRAADAHYSTMPIEDIKALNIPADKNCALFLWAVSPQIPEAFDLIKAWGFEYKTVAFTWAKTYAKSGKPFFSLGYWTRAGSEICLLATRGKIRRVSAAVPQLLISPVREHSRKPDEIRDRIVKLMGDVPRLEMFARQKTEGWDVWGNEVESDIELI